MKLKYNLNDCMPTQQQTWLLQAAVLRGDEAAQAWQKWQAHVNLDEIDPASFRLLPLVYRNIGQLGLNSPLLERLKGVYRHNWYKNQMLFHQAQHIVAQLQNADIPVMFLKGAAMTMHYYEDNGIRFMQDIDVMVPPEKHAQATKILIQNEWQTVFFSTEIMQAYHDAQIVHASGFSKNGFQLDLHRALLPFTNQKETKRWQKASTLNWQGLTVHVLNPTEQLFHACVHGLRWSYGYLTWIPDALLILEKDHENIEWESLVQLAENTRTILFLRNALAYLMDSFQAPIPAAVIQNLANAPVSWTEEKEYKALSSFFRDSVIALTKQRFFQACRYQALIKGSTSPIRLSLTGWMNYFFVFWQLESWWQFSGKLADKLKKNMNPQYRLSGGK